MPRAKGRNSLPAVLLSHTPSFDMFDLQLPSPSIQHPTTAAGLSATPASLPAQLNSRYNPYHRPMPERHIPQNFPPFWHASSRPSSPSTSTTHSGNSPPRTSNSPVVALCNSLELKKKKDFEGSKVPRHIRLELAGAVGATTVGVGDIYAPLLRLLVPEPYDRYGAPAVRSIMAAPTPTLIASALLKQEAPPGSVPNVKPEATDQTVQVQFAQTQHYSTHRAGPSRIATANTPAMSAAFSTVHEWGAVFNSRAAWVTSKVGLSGPLPRAALTVASPFEISNMCNSMMPVPPGPPSHAFLHSRQLAANGVIRGVRGVRAREAVALAVGHTATLKQLIGYGMGVAVVGSRFSRMVALSSTVVVAELNPVVSSAAFTIVNVLNHVFGDDLYDRMPNSFTCLPDRATGFLCGQPMTTANSHFDEVLNSTAMQRFLDLFAASHAIVDNKTQQSQPVHDSIMTAAANHPAPGYYFPNEMPRNDWAAVWALQLARVVIAEVSTELFDILLRELTGTAEPVESKAPAGSVEVEPKVSVAEVLQSSPEEFSFEIDPSHSTKLVVDQYTGIAKIVSVPPQSPSPAQKSGRGRGRKANPAPKAPKTATKENTKAPKPRQPRKSRTPKSVAASTGGRSTPLSEITLPPANAPESPPEGLESEESM